MADEVVSSQCINAQDGMSASPYVWITQNKGYFFRVRGTFRYTDYYTTTDAGVTWSGSSGIQISDTGSFQKDTSSIKVWYDRWTPGDTGTLIYIIWFAEFGGSQAGFFFKTLDTADNTLSDEVIINFNAHDEPTQETGSITKMEDGTLYASITPLNTHEVWRSTDAGATWAQLSADPQDVTQVAKHDIFPTASPDNRDIVRVTLDRVLNELFIDVWDDSVGTWTKTTIGSAGDFTNFLYIRQGISSTFRQSDRATLVCVHEDSFFASHDLRLFEVIWDGSTLTITEKTPIYEAQTYGFGVAITVNNSDDTLYVYYTVGSDESQFITRVKSTDGGVTWGAPVQQSDETVDYGAIINTPQIVGSGRLHPLFTRVSGGDKRNFYQFLGTTSGEGPPDGTAGPGPPGLTLNGPGGESSLREFNNLLIDIAQDILDPPGQTLELKDNSQAPLDLGISGEGNMVIITDDKS